jgi:hypothetical protein
MHDLSKSKSVVTLCGTGVTNGATVTAMVDTLGYKRASIDLITGTANVVSNKPSVLTLYHGATTAYTSATAIATGGTDFTIANADTSNANIYRLDVDTRGRQRYLFVAASPRTTQEVAVVARLGQADESSASATDLGVTGVYRL